MNEPDGRNTFKAIGLFAIGVLVLAALLSGLFELGLSSAKPALAKLSSVDQLREKVEQIVQTAKGPRVSRAVSELDRLPHQHARDIFAGRYSQAPAHKAIAVGLQGHWGYATSRASATMAARAAMWFCERFRLRDEAGGECWVVHIDEQWLDETASQSDYRVHPTMIQRGIMPEAEAVLEGEYAQASLNKAMATTLDGVYGYATGYSTSTSAALAAVGFCERFRDREKTNTAPCVVQIINDAWQ